ncbi:DUF4132 domain-containing protein [Actinoplanes sp. NPDC051861]|uniref:DUF4132 domain-containing protein n=1 Tax=Actinoplanes sp. NPDC051861 TaxID=3155170 RepID=UPI003430C297
MLKDQDSWELPAPWREGLHHRRGSRFTPDPIPPGTTERLRERLASESVGKGVTRLLERTVLFDTTLLADGQRYVAEWERAGEPEPRTASVANQVTRGRAAAEFVDVWVSRFGVEFTTHVVTALVDLVVTGALWVYDPEAEKDYERSWRGDDLTSFSRVLRAFRPRLATASDADYERATEILAAARTTPAGRIVASYLVPTRADWVDADCAQAATWVRDESGGENFSWGDHRYLTGLLLVSASTVEHLAQLEGNVRLHGLSYEKVGEVGTILDAVGPEAAHVLAEPFWLDELRLKDEAWRNRERLRPEAVKLLATVPTDEAFRTVCRHTVESARSRAGLLLKSGLLTRFPERALRILTELEGVHPLYTDLLGGLLLGEPRLLPAVAASLPPAVRARAEEIVASGGAGLGEGWAGLLTRSGLRWQPAGSPRPVWQELDSADEQKRAVTALAGVALDLVVDRIDQKYFRAAFLTAAKRDPERAFRVLTAKATESEVAAELLRDHVLMYSPPSVPDISVSSDRSVTLPVLAGPPRGVSGRALRVPDLPEWLVLLRLPAVRLRDSDDVLSADAVRALCVLLAVSKAGEPNPGVAEVRAGCEPAGLAAFAWGILEQWQAAGHPSRSNLAMVALALLGDDSTVPPLVGLFPSWASAAMRVRTGMDVLAAIGTDLALTHLSRLSRKARTEGFRRFARERLTAVAEARGLAIAQLDDRIVPDLGFGDDGRVEFDYGPRRFTVTLDEHLQPLLADQTGKRLSRLSRNAAAPDQAPYERFAELRKDLKTLGRERTRALEEAMVMERRWTAAEFERHFVRHPLMWQLTRRLLWATFDSGGTVTATFRAAEDRTFADVDDKTWTLDPDAVVGLAHPWHFTGERSAWAELFADYAVIQPFPQIGRELLTESDAPPPPGTSVAGKRLFALSALGWDFTSGHNSLVRYWPDGHSAEIVFGPGYHWQETDLPQELHSLLIRTRDGSPAELGALSPIARSEVLRDLLFLVS